MQRIDLSGAWEFWRDAEGAGESMAAGWPGYEQTTARTANWEPITVPGHWQAQGFAGYQGPGWYRLTFEAPAEVAGRPFLEFGGVDFYADVWLNGDYLGFHEGDFEPFAFDVSAHLKPGQPNLLVVRVAAPLDARPVRQAPAPGTPEVPSAANPQYPSPVENPAGIWRKVEVAYRPALHVASVKVTPVLEETHARGDVFVEVTFENYTGRPISEPLRLWVGAHNFEGTGARQAFLVTALPGRCTQTYVVPMKAPALWWSWDLGTPHLYNLMLFVGGEQAPRREVRFGFREFTKGDNWELYLNGRRFFARGTNYLSDRFLSRMTPERYAEDVRLMREAHMNVVRVFAHLEDEEFYRLCDEQGIMLLQDLPFQWGYEPDGLFIQRAANVARAAVRQLYNHPAVVMLCAHSESRIHDFYKLDEVLLQAVRDVDVTRPVSVRWHWGRLEDVEAYVPERLEELVERSQAYQSRYCKVTIEALRRKKYRPVNGLLQFLFADNWPAITWSILDYDRVTKPAYQAVKEAFNPLLLTFTFYPAQGQAAVWVVNDFPREFEGLRLLYRYDGAALQVVNLPEIEEDSAEAVAWIPLPAGAAKLEAVLVDAAGAALSQWEGEVVPYRVPANVERPSIV